MLFFEVILLNAQAPTLIKTLVLSLAAALIFHQLKT